MIIYRTPLRRMNIMQVDEDTYRASGKHRLGIWMLLNRLTCKIVQRGVDRDARSNSESVSVLESPERKSGQTSGGLTHRY